MLKPSLFDELKRRSVFKVMAAYLVVAWLLVQVADNAVPALHLPEWTVSLIWVLLIVGFPIALLLAWAYDLTPAGIRPTRFAGTGAEPDSDDPAASSAPAALAAPATVVPPDAATALASVCVLPFRNLVTSAEHRYLADAMTLELQSLFSSCRDLRVVSHASAAAQSAAGGGLKQIASELGVQYVITGSVAAIGARFRITAELDDARADRVLWSDQFNIEIEDVWDTQSRIAETIVGTFGGERMRNEVKQATSAAADGGARELVQKARAYLLDYGAETIAEARALLVRATELDPDFAEAHAALGLVTAEATINGASADADADRRAATAAIARAEALGPQDPNVLRAAGCVHAYTGDYARSLALLRRAVKLAPFDLGAWGYLGWPLVATGRPEHLDELHAIMDRLLTTAPRHPGRAYWLFHKSVALACADAPEQAVDLAQESTLEQPGFALGLMHYANVLGRLGRHETAQAMAERSVAVNANMTPRFYAALMRVLTDQNGVVDRRTSGLAASGLL